MTAPGTPGLFITGTDTEVGKTYVAARIARALLASGMRVGVYKPVASGCVADGDDLVAEDAVALWQAAGRPGTLQQVCPQCFAAALAPHAAARVEGRRVDPQLLRSGIEFWQQHADIVLVEGAGGLMSPVSDDDYNADLADDFGFPLIVVAPNCLGVINQTLQTLITAATFRDGLDVAGVVLNDVRTLPSDASTSSNRAELQARCVPPVLTHLHHGAEDFDVHVDWLALARRPS
jgi:dethiobiotin synthetase